MKVVITGSDHAIFFTYLSEKCQYSLKFFEEEFKTDTELLHGAVLDI